MRPSWDPGGVGGWRERRNGTIGRTMTTSPRARAEPATTVPLGRVVALAVLLAALVAVAIALPAPDLVRVRAWTAALGAPAPLLFGLLYAVAVPAPVPKSVLTTAAGLVFGIPLGATVVVAGGTAGAIGAFLLARFLGRDAVAGLAHGRLDRVDALVERHGMLAALVVRWVPVLPFTILNYACGVTAMRLRHYALGTVIGLVPGSTFWVAVGSLGGEVSPWLPTGVSLGAAAVTLLTGAGLARRRARLSIPGDTVSTTLPEKLIDYQE